MLEDRSDGVRPLGEFAFWFLKKCEENDCTIFYSKLVIFELSKFPNFMKEINASFGIDLVEAGISVNQKEEAKTLAKNKCVPFNDALHAVLARDNKAILVTRDKHFEELSAIIVAVVPEAVIFDL